MQTKFIEIPDKVERLLMVSDLHSFVEPLLVLDGIIAKLPERTQVVAVGDYFFGGANPVETLEWVRAQAGEFAVLGNTEIALLSQYDKNISGGVKDEDFPPYTLAGALRRLNAQQIEYLRNLPRMLELRWRGMQIRVLHGDQKYSGEPAPWKSKPGQLLDYFGDPSVTLTVVGHTHYPFVRQKDGARIANCGSTSRIILRWKREDGTMELQGDEPGAELISGIYSTFLFITVERGELQVTVERFDYDRKKAIKRLWDAGDPKIEGRKVWLETGDYP